MPHLNASQNRYLRLFTRYVDIDSGRVLDEEFNERINRLRLLGITESEYRATIKDRHKEPSPLAQFLLDYHFPYAMAEFIRTYITECTINPQLIHSGLFLVSEADETASGYNEDKRAYTLYEQTKTHGGRTESTPELKLVIPSGVKLNEVKAFLDEHWGSFVQGKMRLYEARGSAPNRRIRSRTTAAIESYILELKAQGNTAADIALRVNARYHTSYTYNNINQIYYRIRHRSR